MKYVSNSTLALDSNCFKQKGFFFFLICGCLKEKIVPNKQKEPKRWSKTVQSLSVREAFNGIASCKIFCLSFMFHHFHLHLVDALFALMLFLHLVDALFAFGWCSFLVDALFIICIWLMLFLHEHEQVLILVKQFASASLIDTFLSSRYHSHVSSFSQLVVCKRRNPFKAFKFSK